MTIDIDELSEEVEVVLRERCADLEAAEADGTATPETLARLDAVRSLLAAKHNNRPAVPKHFGKARPVIADFYRKADKWGNA